MNNKNIGYKCLDMNMKPIHGNKNFQYKMNKIYYMNEEDINIGFYGFHYYKELKNICELYSFNTNTNRIFEVEILGKEISNNNIQYCTNSIRIIRELNQEDINKYIEDNIKDLVNDKESYIRVEVANHGYGLDILINDESWSVRTEVVRRGYCLDKLVNDENWIVRAEVAKQGYGLDILINDEDQCVRREVAKQGYGLDILINDENWYVRKAANYKLKIIKENK